MALKRQPRQSYGKTLALSMKLRLERGAE